MEVKNENQVISEIIRTLPSDYYATEQSKNYYRQYDGCDDFLISDKLINGIWDFFNYKIMNLSDLGNENIPATVSVLHTNSGAGKILEKAPNNTTLFAYNLDYVCKKITDILCQDKSKEGNYFSKIRDISEYYIARETNNSRKYDIVITQPMPNMTFYRGVDCKALMDLVIVVKEAEGSIIKVKPIDLKTMAGSTLLFNSSLKTRRYDIQGAWYTLAVNSWLRGQDTLSNIVIDPFLFIVESSTHQGTPLVFEMHPDLLILGKSGREAEINYVSKPEAVLKQRIIGYDNLLDDYLFYESNDWTLDKRIPVDVSTPILMNWNGIV